MEEGIQLPWSGTPGNGQTWEAQVWKRGHKIHPYSFTGFLEPVFFVRISCSAQYSVAGLGQKVHLLYFIIFCCNHTMSHRMLFYLFLICIGLLRVSYSIFASTHLTDPICVPSLCIQVCVIIFFKSPSRGILLSKWAWMQCFYWIAVDLPGAPVLRKLFLPLLEANNCTKLHCRVLWKKGQGQSQPFPGAEQDGES